MKNSKQIIVSFSGGETSAFMAIKLKEKYGDRVSFVFANTSQENDETLNFVNAVDSAYDLGVVWIEAVANPEYRKGTEYRITDYKKAKRNGEVFEDIISVYGLPNMAFKHCSRELKTIPLKKWAENTYDNYAFAIGIRTDEIDRINPNHKKEKIIYPLVTWLPTTKNEINRFWRDQPFRLNLKHYEGNCKWCWKKADHKLNYLAKINPEIFDFPERMEVEHKYTSTPDRKGSIPDEGARIFRKGRTVKDIREASEFAEKPIDDARIYDVNSDLFGFDNLDSCGSGSCEPF